MNKGKTVFSQVMDMIPRREFDNIVSKYNGNRYAKQLCHDQFLIMCMAQYADKNSLRDIEASPHSFGFCTQAVCLWNPTCSCEKYAGRC